MIRRYLSFVSSPRWSHRFPPGRLLAAGVLAAIAVGTAYSAQVSLTWSDNSANESGFRIERALGSGGFAEVATTAANIRTYADTSVAAGSTYQYRVRAYNSASTSSYSNAVSVTVPTTTPVNTAPTISNITDGTIALNGTTGAIAFTVGDAQTAAGDLTVTGSSSNTTLVPTSGIIFGGSGANRTVTVRPSSNRTGTATITVRVSDGSLTATDTFVLTVTGSSTNTAPTISNITDRSIAMNGTTGAIAFTVGDAQTAAGSLTVTGSSSNTTLVPASAITWGGSGASRTVTVTPASNRTGTATITVRVSDGSLTATDTFVVAVTSSSTTTNTAPTITSIPGQTIQVNGISTAIPFTIGDAQTPAGSLTLIRNCSDPSLIPLQNITFGGSGASRTVTIRPVTNRTGWATVWVKVSDGSLSAYRGFVVTVRAGLTLVDVGLPAIKGSQTLSGSTITVTAGGVNPSSFTDQLSFGYLPLTGDSEITVQLGKLVAAGVQSRAGLMFRASNASNAAHVAIYVTAASRLTLEWRASTGGMRRSTSPLAGTAPQWLRLTRAGDAVYAFASDDGKTWELVEFATVDLPDTALAGVAASSQVANQSTIATFGSVTID